jgi:glycosyltransferase involved in cell wall biosynthesis
MNYPVRTLVLTSGRDDKQPWWWDLIDHDRPGCQLDYQKLPLKGARITSVFSLQFAAYAIRVLSVLRQARHRYSNILTFECGWESFLIALVQTVTCSHRPRHVILQFIMREKQQSLKSRIKYVFMRWCFSSVYLCICSSRSEIKYYQDVFGWPREKFGYIPLHTDPRLLDHKHIGSEGFILSAGRTFRDYDTLLDAFRNLEVPMLIVASRASIGAREVPPHVVIKYDLPSVDLIDLMARCLAVVIPLENRLISIGQSVLLQAMTLGKAVIVTRVNGTEDYLEHMETGIFVPPNDPEAIAAAVSLLVGDEALRKKLGRAAQDRVKRMYLPRHYANEVSALLQ